MGLISMKCPACGAVLENVDESREFFFCTYCGNKITYEKQRIEMTGEVSLAGVATAKSLLARGTNALEDGKYDAAAGFFDRALDSNPQLAEAYMGKLAARNRCHQDIDLQKLPIRYTRMDESQSEDDNMILYRRACQYAKGELKEKYEWINGPYHIAICELHEATGNIQSLEKQMKREHDLNESQKKSAVSSAENELKYATENLASCQRSLKDHKKWEWRDIGKPIVFFIILGAAAFFMLSRGNTGGFTLILCGAALISFLVVVIKAIVISGKISKSYQKQNADKAEERLTRAQNNLPKTQKEYSQYQTQMAEEKQRFAAYANSVLQPLADKVQMFKENS